MHRAGLCGLSRRAMSSLGDRGVPHCGGCHWGELWLLLLLLDIGFYRFGMGMISCWVMLGQRDREHVDDLGVPQPKRLLRRDKVTTASAWGVDPAGLCRSARGYAG